MNKDSRVIAGKHDVRPPRQPLVMKPESKACCVKIATDLNFRASIHSTDATHHPRSDGGADDVQRENVNEVARRLEILPRMAPSGTTPGTMHLLLLLALHRLHAHSCHRSFRRARRAW